MLFDCGAFWLPKKIPVIEAITITIGSTALFADDSFMGCNAHARLGALSQFAIKSFTEALQVASNKVQRSESLRCLVHRAQDLLTEFTILCQRSACSFKKRPCLSRLVAIGVLVFNFLVGGILRVFRKVHQNHKQRFLIFNKHFTRGGTD